MSEYISEDGRVSSLAQTKDEEIERLRAENARLRHLIDNDHTEIERLRTAALSDSGKFLEYAAELLGKDEEIERLKAQVAAMEVARAGGELTDDALRICQAVEEWISKSIGDSELVAVASPVIEKWEDAR